ncbi:sensor histidine kinase, partial [Klebsiella pneumoniae]|nr:sensor histidine kinase [Klebsiella pneumoniae]
GGQLATILFVQLVLGVALPLAPMLAALAVLAALNLAIGTIAARRPIGDTALFATLLVDVACLSVQLFLSGGVANPFVTLYLL